MASINDEVNGKRNSNKSHNKGGKQNERFAWERAIDDIAREFFNNDWDTVTNLNIYRFNHYADFLTDKRRREAEEIKKQQKRIKRGNRL